MADELRACVVDSAPGFVRGDLVAGDHPTVVARPEAFTPWEPPPVETLDGERTTEASVVTESFARGDRVYLRGDVLDRKDPTVKAVKRCVAPWSPPPVRLANGELHTSAQPKKSSRRRKP